MENLLEQKKQQDEIREMLVILHGLSREERAILMSNACALYSQTKLAADCKLSPQYMQLNEMLPKGRLRQSLRLTSIRARSVILIKDMEFSINPNGYPLNQ